MIWPTAANDMRWSRGCTQHDTACMLLGTEVTSVPNSMHAYQHNGYVGVSSGCAMQQQGAASIQHSSPPSNHWSTALHMQHSYLRVILTLSQLDPFLACLPLPVTTCQIQDSLVLLKTTPTLPLLGLIHGIGTRRTLSHLKLPLPACHYLPLPVTLLSLPADP
jgi:hypothetical protein